MKICIVTGIFEPESGGPATYAPTLAQMLSDAGHEITAITFSSQTSYPTDTQYTFRLIRITRGNKILNRIRFFFKALPSIRSSDCVYMLDQFAVGLPVALAARMTGTPYIVRVGGDYLWEQRYIGSGKTPIALGEFYYAGFYKHYPVLYRLIRFVLRGAAEVVFNSDIQCDLYKNHYGLNKTTVIYNPVPQLETSGIVRGTPNKEFVFWGRFIIVKNLLSLIRAFAQAHLPGYSLVLIGDGPQKGALQALITKLNLAPRVRMEATMSLNTVLRRVKDSRASVLPSWSDISPNQVYESLAIGLPALVTSENYLSIRSELPETIDPGSVSDIAAKLEMLADDAKYAAFTREFSAINFSRGWSDVVREHIALFEKVTRV